MNHETNDILMINTYSLDDRIHIAGQFSTDWWLVIVCGFSVGRLAAVGSVLPFHCLLKESEEKGRTIPDFAFFFPAPTVFLYHNLVLRYSQPSRKSS